MKRSLVRAGILAAAVTGIVGVAGPALAEPVFQPEKDLYLFSDYYVGVNWTGWSIDAIANCRRDAEGLTGGAYVARCTATAYGARLDVYQVS